MLKDAVESVMRQTYLSVEVIVVDDASSDGTGAWLATLQEARLNTLILSSHVERAVARNLGLERAQGQFVLFLDDDDRLRRSSLERLHRALDAHPEAIAAVGGRTLFDEGGQERKLPHPRRRFLHVVWQDLLAGWMAPPGSILWRTHIVRAAGGWAEEIPASGDRELLVRCSRLGPMVFVPGVALEKRVHGGQWRVADIRQVQANWMLAHLATLPERQRERGRRLSKTYRYLNDARIAYGNLHSLEALLLYFRAVRISPSVLRSPLLLPDIARGVGKSLLGVMLGRRGTLLARRWKHDMQSKLHRDVYEIKRQKPGNGMPNHASTAHRKRGD